MTSCQRQFSEGSQVGDRKIKKKRIGGKERFPKDRKYKLKKNSSERFCQKTNDSKNINVRVSRRPESSY